MESGEMRLRVQSLAGPVAMLLLASLAVAPAKGRGKWPIYQGAWFSIAYPPGFKARASLPSATSVGEGECDSAFFRSADGEVEFYVYSPQWYGEPSDILVNSKTEKVISSRTEIIEAAGGWAQSSNEMERTVSKTTWQTIRAKDGSYTRSYVNIIHGPSARGDLIGQRCFGFKYVSHAAYVRYRSDYARFKESLGQSAD
jgi:hypothetical protein